MFKKYFFVLGVAFTGLNMETMAKNLPTGESLKPKACLYPEDPINWIMAYCASEVGTDDEIALQESSCFKKAEADLKQKNECGIKAKYKKMLCSNLIRKKLASKDKIDSCLKDESIKPFFAGE